MSRLLSLLLLIPLFGAMVILFMPRQWVNGIRRTSIAFMLVELVATSRVSAVSPWSEGPLPGEHAVRGLHGATIWEDGDAGSAVDRCPP